MPQTTVIKLDAPPRGSFANSLERPTMSQIPPVLVTNTVDSLLAGLLPSSNNDNPPNTTLRQLDYELDQLAAIYQSIKAEVLTRSADLSKQKNALVPVNNLPVELLVDVLWWCIATVLPHPGRRPNQKVGRAMELSVVCTRWWRVLTEASPLWTELEYGGPGCNLALQRSKSRPLTIRAFEWGTRYGYSVQDFLGAVRPHVQRFRTLECQGSCADDFKDLLTSTPLPALQALGLDMTSRSTLHITDAPALRELSLRAVNLPWDSVSFPRLTRLTVSELNNPNLSRLYNFIQSPDLLPKLERLILRNLLFKGDEEAEPPVDPPRTSDLITFPNLTTLELTNVTGRTPLSLLARIRADNLKEFTLSDYLSNSTAILATLAKRDPCRSLILTAINNSHSKTINVTVMRSGVQIAWPDSQINLSEPSLIIDDVIQATHIDLTTSSIHVILSGERANWDAWDDAHADTLDTSFLDRLDTTTVLEDNYTSSKHLQSILKYLSTPRADGRWVCPQLTTVRLQANMTEAGSDTASPIVEAVRSFNTCRPQVSIFDRFINVFGEGEGLK